MNDQLEKALYDASMALMTPEMRQLWNEKQALTAKVARIEGENERTNNALLNSARLIGKKNAELMLLQAECERLRLDAANANKLLAEIHITKDEEWLYSTYGEPDWIARRDAQINQSNKG